MAGDGCIKNGAVGRRREKQKRSKAAELVVNSFRFVVLAVAYPLIDKQLAACGRRSTSCAGAGLVTNLIRLNVVDCCHNPVMRMCILVMIVIIHSI